MSSSGSFGLMSEDWDAWLRKNAERLAEVERIPGYDISPPSASLLEKKMTGATCASFHIVGFDVCEECLFRDGVLYEIDAAIALDGDLSCSCSYVWDGSAYMKDAALSEFEEAKRALGLSFSLRPCVSLCSPEVYRLASSYLADYIPFKAEWDRVCFVSAKYGVRMGVAAKFLEAEKRASEARRLLLHHVHNLIRDAKGLPRVGEGWVNETALFRIVQSLFPSDEVIHHYRAPWLGRLELDVYVSGANIGFEYQGIQHYVAQPHWGGEEAFIRGRERDKEKARRCAENGTRLIEVKYDEAVTEEVVRRKLGDVQCDSL